MEKGKRLISSLVALIVVLALVPATAFGQGGSNTAGEISHEHGYHQLFDIDLGTTVYVSRTNKYHLRSNCSDMKYYTAMSLESALNNNAQACKICANVAINYNSGDTPPEPEPAPPVEYRGFYDVSPEDWVVTEGWLDYVLDKGIMSGYSASYFGPYDSISRGQAAVVLYRVETGKTANNTDNYVSTRFSDVPRGQYYSAAVQWASELGIVTGYDNGYFRPDKTVTREELATMIARYARICGGFNLKATSEEKFYSLEGHDQVSSFAREGLVWCVDKGIIGGIEGRYLNPQDGAWRASMAKIITVTLRDVMNK